MPRSSTDSTFPESRKHLETEGSDKNSSMNQVLWKEDDSTRLERNYSHEQLLLFLREKKAVVEDPHAFIKEVHEDIDVHPIAILTALGVDMRNKLEDNYLFFRKTRYHSQQATYRRDRTTKDGHHCWTQGGGRKPILDENAKAVTGFLRKFRFMKKTKKQMSSVPVMIGSTSYSFRLEELVLAEDEEAEKTAASRKQNPESFLCVYRLLHVTQSNHGTYDGVGGQSSNPHQTFPSSSNLESASPLSWRSEIEHLESEGGLLFDLAIPDFDAAMALPLSFDVPNLESAPALPLDFDEI